MQKESEQKPADSSADDATSSKTLSDVEESEKVTDARDDKESSAPLSPDGAVNSDKNERNPNEDAGPM